MSDWRKTYKLEYRNQFYASGLFLYPLETSENL